MVFVCIWRVSLNLSSLSNKRLQVESCRSGESRTVLICNPGLPRLAVTLQLCHNLQSRQMHYSITWAILTIFSKLTLHFRFCSNVGAATSTSGRLCFSQQPNPLWDTSIATGDPLLCTRLLTSSHKKPEKNLLKYWHWTSACWAERVAAVPQQPQQSSRLFGTRATAAPLLPLHNCGPNRYHSKKEVPLCAGVAQKHPESTSSRSD